MKMRKYMALGIMTLLLLSIFSLGFGSSQVADRTDLEDNDLINKASLNEESDVDYVVICPEEDQTVEAGEELLFDAEAYDEEDDLITDDPEDFEWENASARGEFIETEAGEYNVTATYDDVTSEPTLVEVVPAEAVEFWIEPEESTITAGESQEFIAYGVDEYDNEFNVTDETTWSYDIDPDNRTWDDNVITVTEAGNWTITGEYKEFTNTSILNVDFADLDYVVIDPEEDQTIEAGEELLFDAEAYDVEGNLITDDLGDFEWENTLPSGEFVKTEAGTYEVTATYDGVTSPVTNVTVEPAEAVDFWIEPEESTINAGESQEYRAYAEDEYGNVFEVADETEWSDDIDPDNRTWDDNVITVTEAGNWTITGEYVNKEGEKLTNTSILNVDFSDVDYVVIDPEEDQNITAGEELLFDAEAYDVEGNLITDHHADFEWENTLPFGEFVKTEADTYEVTATYQGVTSPITNVTVEPAEAVEFWIEPEESTINAGESQKFIAYGVDEYDNEFNVTDETTWSDDIDLDNRTWDDNFITVTEAGNWTITGEFENKEGETLTNTSILNVDFADVDYVVIDPEEDQNITAGEELLFDAEAYDEYDNLITDHYADFEWENTLPFGEFVKTEAGTYEVTATYQGVTSPITNMTVEPAEAVDFWIEPGEATIVAGEPQEFIAYGVDEYGNEFNVTDETTWSDDVDPEEDSVWEENTITINRTGEWTINGKYEEFENTSTLEIEPAAADNIITKPEQSTITAGDTETYTATAYDEFGNEIGDVTEETVWSIDEEAGGDWDQVEGIYTSEFAGEWTVTGEYENEIGATLTNISTLNVEPAEADHIGISPQESTITAGESEDYTAILYDEFGNEIGDVTEETVWSIEEEAEGDWDQVTGVYTAEFAGEWTVTGEYNSEELDPMKDTVDLEVTPADATYIEIEPEYSIIRAGETEDYTATAYDEFGNDFDVTEDTEWSIDEEAGGDWDNGVYTGEVAGEWTVTGEYDPEELDPMTDTVALEVTPADADYIEIEPEEETVEAGQEVDYTATAYDEFGNEIGEVTEETVWSIEEEAGGDWDQVTGVYTAKFAGEWTVTGEYDPEELDPITETVNLEVTPADADYIEIEPEEETVEAGQEVDYTATAYDEFGNEIGEVTEETVWSIEEEAGGDWDQVTGVYTAEVAGEWTVTGEHDSEELDPMTDTVDLEVTPADVESVTIDPSEDFTLTVGEEENFSAEAYDEFGNLITDDDTDFTWTNTDEEGEFIEIEAGEYEVNATYDGTTSDTVTVTVEPADVDEVVITPDTDQTIDAGDTIEFSAEAYDEYDNLITDDDADFTWENTDDTGLFDETEAGGYEVTATYEGETSVTITVSVEPADVSYVEIDPSEDFTLTAGEEENFSAEAYDEYDNLITDDDTDFTWTNADEEGEFIEIEAGEYEVNATYEGTTSVTVTVTVEPADVHEVVITPDTDQKITAGETIEFSAEAYDEYGNLITEDPEDFTWKNAPDGVFEKFEAGEYEVKAEIDNVSSEPVTVDNVSEVKPTIILASVILTSVGGVAVYKKIGGKK